MKKDEQFYLEEDNQKSNNMKVSSEQGYAQAQYCLEKCYYKEIGMHKKYRG